jgi:glycosyltransferase involved in cell wall biosynthesis
VSAESARASALVHITTVPMTIDAFLVEQLNDAARAGYDVHVITASGPELGRVTRRLNGRVHLVQMRRGLSPHRDLLGLVALVRVLSAIKPDVVHAHTPKAGLLGMMAASLVRVPLRVYTVHGLATTDAAGLLGRISRLTDVVACRLAHVVLAVSASLKAELVRRGTVAADGVTVLGSGSVDGVDAGRRFNPAVVEPARREVRAQHALPIDAFVVGYAGRLAGDKGLSDLASAWRLVKEQVPQARLLVVGSQDSRDPISAELLREWNNDPRVVLAPFRPDIERFYAAMDCLVLPSYREGLGMVALEAAAMGLPAIVNRVCGCVDAVVDGVTGAVVDTRDPSVFAGAIAAYATRPDVAAAHGVRGRRRVLDEFRPEVVRQSLFMLYARGLGQYASGAPPVSAQVAQP